jgi:hypothetical protein
MRKIHIDKLSSFQNKQLRYIIVTTSIQDPRIYSLGKLHNSRLLEAVNSGESFDWNGSVFATNASNLVYYSIY